MRRAPDVARCPTEIVLRGANGWRVSTEACVDTADVESCEPSWRQGRRLLVEARLHQGCNSYAYAPQFVPSDESGVIPRDSGSHDC